MNRNDPRAFAWRSAVMRELIDRDMSRAGLARAIGVVPQAVGNWLNEVPEPRQPPDPEVVFAIEDALDAVDRLAPILGYIRPSSRPAHTLEEVLSRDPDLTAADRNAILAMREALVNRRQRGRSKAAK